MRDIRVSCGLPVFREWMTFLYSAGTRESVMPALRGERQRHAMSADAWERRRLGPCDRPGKAGGHANLRRSGRPILMGC